MIRNLTAIVSKPADAKDTIFDLLFFRTKVNGPGQYFL